MKILPNVLSEEKMADVFEVVLRNHQQDKWLPHFQSVFREISCQQGIPDFITISSSHNIDLKALFGESSVSIESCSAVISLLKMKAPRTTKYISTCTGLKIESVKRILKQLENEEFVKSINSNSYVLGPKWSLPDMELWAFELKLDNWRRALFQALQYKAFANRVVVVFPESKGRILKKNIEIFNKLNIGIMTFDFETSSYNVILKPTKSSPSSKKHNLFALGQIALAQKE